MPSPCVRMHYEPSLQRFAFSPWSHCSKDFPHCVWMVCTGQLREARAAQRIAHATPNGCVIFEIVAWPRVSLSSSSSGEDVPRKREGAIWTDGPGMRCLGLEEREIMGSILSNALSERRGMLPLLSLAKGTHGHCSALISRYHEPLKK